MEEFTELDETFGDMTLGQLIRELNYQIEVMGETPGGEVCGYIQNLIGLKKQNNEQAT